MTSANYSCSQKINSKSSIRFIMTWDSQADSWAPANGAPTFSDEGAGATSSNHVEETYGDFGDNGPAGSGDRACFKCGETG